MDMIRSLGLVSLALLAWLLISHPRTPEAVREVEWVPVAVAAAQQADYQVVAPADTFAWPATSARLEPQSDGTLAWQVGYYTPQEAYAALMQRGRFPAQAAQAQQEWIDTQTRNGVVDGTVIIDDRNWTRLVGDPVPDDRRSLVIQEAGTVTLVTGSASWAELETLAAELDEVAD